MEKGGKEEGGGEVGLKLPRPCPSQSRTSDYFYSVLSSLARHLGAVLLHRLLIVIHEETLLGSACAAQ